MQDFRTQTPLGLKMNEVASILSFNSFSYYGIVVKHFLIPFQGKFLLVRTCTGEVDPLSSFTCCCGRSCSHRVFPKGALDCFPHFSSLSASSFQVGSANNSISLETNWVSEIQPTTQQIFFHCQKKNVYVIIM